MRFSLHKRGQSNGAAPEQPQQTDRRPFERAHPFSMYVLRRLKRNRPVAEMTQAEIQQSYWQVQADRQRQAAETQIALERARAEHEAGIPHGSESTVSWRQGNQQGSGWLDRRF